MTWVPLQRKPWISKSLYISPQSPPINSPTSPIQIPAHHHTPRSKTKSGPSSQAKKGHPPNSTRRLKNPSTKYPACSRQSAATRNTSARGKTATSARWRAPSREFSTLALWRADWWCVWRGYRSLSFASFFRGRGKVGFLFLFRSYSFALNSNTNKPRKKNTNQLNID